MPIPIDRTDEAFYEPLRDLKLAPGTELYLGLVHAKDGVQGTKTRVDMAGMRAVGTSKAISMPSGAICTKMVSTWRESGPTFVVTFGAADIDKDRTYVSRAARKDVQAGLAGGAGQAAAKLARQL